MRARLRGVAAVLAGLCLLAGPAACGKAGGVHEPGGPASGGALKIGVLLPDNTSRLYHFDKPLIEKKIHQLCPNARWRSSARSTMWPPSSSRWTR